MLLRLAALWMGAVAILAGSLAAAEKSTPAADATAGWKLLYSEAFDSSPSADWHINKGTWKIVGGAWQGSEVPADKHAAVARHDFKFTDAVIELDFKFDGAKMTTVSINDAKAHVCRLQIMPNRFRVMKDDYDRTGPMKGEVLAEKTIDLKPDAWHHLRIELKGQKMTAQVDDASAGGENAQVAMPKASLALVVTGQTASFRNLRFSVPAE